MNTPSSSSRILLLADRRVRPDGGVRVQRYRLARVARVRLDETGPRLVDSKRA